MNLTLRHPDGRPMARLLGVSFDGAWFAIQRAVAREFECEPDEIDLIELDDGTEAVEVRGRGIVGAVARDFDMPTHRCWPVAAE